MHTDTPRQIYWWAIRRGWSLAEAGNWAAWNSGLPLALDHELPTTAWTLRAVNGILFTRWLVEQGRLGGPNDTATTTNTTSTRCVSAA